MEKETFENMTEAKLKAIVNMAVTRSLNNGIDPRMINVYVSYSELTLKDAIAIFMNSRESDNVTDQTISYYKNALKWFIEFIGEDTKIMDISIDDINKYKTQLANQDNKNFTKSGKKKKLSKKTVQNYVRALRAFLGYLYDEGMIIGTDPRKRIKLPKADEKVQEILKEEEITKIMNESFDKNKAIGCRNLAMISLMLDSMMRRGGLVDINIEDIDFKRKRVKIVEKGKKERIVPVSSYTSNLLFKYITYFRPEPLIKGENAAFLSKDRKRIGVGAVRTAVETLKNKTDIERLHPHLFRHTGATNYIMNEGKMPELQTLLGHTSMDMTRKYVTLANTEHVLKAYKDKSLLDKMTRERKL